MTAIRASASSSPSSFKDVLNFPDAAKCGDVLRALAFGDLLLGQLVQNRRSVDMDAAATSPFTLSTLDCLAMRSSNFPPALSILRATVRAGGVTGELTPVAYGATPSTTQIAVAPNGSIVTLGTDAITNMDVLYIPERGLVIEYTGPVVSATGVMAIPTSIIGNGIILLLEAEVLAGAVTGNKVVLVPGTTGPATTTCRLAVAKTSVNFNQATDTPTRARVKFFVAQAAADGLVPNTSLPATFV